MELYGEPSIWDGRLIKKRLTGNSVLYILTDEVWFTFQVTHLVTLGTALSCAVQIIYRLKNVINNTNYCNFHVYINALLSSFPNRKMMTNKIQQSQTCQLTHARCIIRWRQLVKYHTFVTFNNLCCIHCWVLK